MLNIIEIESAVLNNGSVEKWIKTASTAPAFRPAQVTRSIP
jgi:hypothetical protein